MNKSTVNAKVGKIEINNVPRKTRLITAKELGERLRYTVLAEKNRNKQNFHKRG